MKTPGHSVIGASAGAGKTFQLSSRYIRLLAGGVKPSAILATTFTKKAAGEIRERVFTRLTAAAMDAKAAGSLADEIGLSGALELADARRILRDLCRSLQGASIGTLDSYFNRVAMCFRHELGIPSTPMIADERDPMISALRAQAVDSMLASEDIETMASLLRDLHAGGAKRSVGTYLESILGAMYARYRETDEAAWSRLLGVGRRPAAEELREIAKRISRLADSTDGTALPKRMKKDVLAIAEGNGIALLGDGLVLNVREGMATYGKTKIPADIYDAYRELNVLLTAEALDFVDRRTRSTWKLLDRFHARFSELRRRKRILLFDDFPLLLCRELRVRGRGRRDQRDMTDEISYRVNAEIAHLLLDEFQDTSLTQWETLRPLAQRLVRSGESSVFAVGDRKQSIYVWRVGCSEVFERLIDDLKLDAAAFSTIDRNYRSSPVILKAVNSLFSNIAASPALIEFSAAAARWDAHFRPHSAVKSELGGLVQVTTAPRYSEEAAGEEESDSAGGLNSKGAVIAECVRLAANLWNESGFREIAVLTATNDIAQSVIAGLRGKGIAASGEGGSTLSDEPAVALIISAMKLADQPGDTASAFHVLHSPLADSLGLESMVHDRVADLSRRIRCDLMDRGHADVVAAWAAALAPHCDRRGALRLERLIELADTFEARAGFRRAGSRPAGQALLRPAEFVDFVEATRVDDPTSAKVRVMTIHKAKGLEFETVIVPCAHKRMGDVSRERLIAHRSDPTSSIDAVFRRPGAELEGVHPLIDEAIRQEKERRLEDDLCALYVAATRPRHALYIILSPLESTKSKSSNGIGKRGYSDSSWATLIRDKLRDTGVSEHFDGGQVLYEDGDRQWWRRRDTPRGGEKDAGEFSAPEKATSRIEAEPVRLSLPTISTMPRRNPRHVSATESHGPGVVRAARFLELARDPLLTRGVILHAWFETIGWIDDGVPCDDELRRIARRTNDVTEEKMERLLADFRKSLERDVVRSALSCPAMHAGVSYELWREREFAVLTEGRLLSGRIDRVVISKDGERAVKAEVVDFKTDRVSSREEASRRGAEYRTQLDSYARAVSKILRLDEGSVTASILFVEAGERIVL